MTVQTEYAGYRHHRVGLHRFVFLSYSFVEVVCL